MGKGPFAYPIPPWLLGPLALCAGCAAMILVLLQAAGFAYLYGFGVETQTTVLATFVGGFALGAVIVGLRSDSSQHPLRWFGVLQVGLGFFAFGAPTIAGLLGDAPSLALMATAMLLLPGMLTGGAAVLLVRAGAHTTERGALALGSVTAAQALGAALAFPVLAVASTGTMAAVGASLQVLVGTLAWGLSVPTGKRSSRRRSGPP